MEEVNTEISMLKYDQEAALFLFSEMIIFYYPLCTPTHSHIHSVQTFVHKIALLQVWWHAKPLDAFQALSAVTLKRRD